MEPTLRPMTASQVLDRTFYLYRSNFILFMGIALIVPALRLVFSLGELLILGKPPVPDPAQPDLRLFQELIPRFALEMSAGAVIFFVGSALASAATAYAVSAVHLGRATTIAESYQRVKPVFWRVLGLTLWVFFISAWLFLLAYVILIVVGVGALVITKGGRPSSDNMGLAFALLGGLLVAFLAFAGGLVWMVYAACKYALAVPAAVVENLPARQAMRRSRFLSDGSKGRIFGIYALTILMSVILGSVLEAPILFGHNIFTAAGQKSMTLASHVLLQLAQFAGTALAGPIATIAMAVVYYDQRVRKEAFDLQIMMQAIGGAGAATGPEAIQ